MKRFQILLLSLLLPLFPVAQVPVYINIGSHTETNDPLQYDNNANDFAAMKSLLAAMRDTILANTATWNMQLESRFIIGALNFDSAATNSMDIIQALDAEFLIEVDPHNHFDSLTNPYNYPDLVHLLDSCGLPGPFYTMGGFIWRDFPALGVYEDWTKFQNPVAGHTYPQTTWQPQIIWGAGSPNHIDDFEAYGVIKPKAATPFDFITHWPQNDLYYMGNGCNDNFRIEAGTDPNFIIANVQALVNWINANPSPADTFYTVTLQTNFRDYSPAYVQKVGQILRGLQPLTQAHSLEWKTLSQKMQEFRSLHPVAGDHFLQECTQVPLAAETPRAAGPTLAPNPAHDHTRISLPAQAPWEAHLHDVQGRVLRSLRGSGDATDLSLQGLPAGIYILSLTQQAQTWRMRIVVE